MLAIHHLTRRRRNTDVTCRTQLFLSGCVWRRRAAAAEAGRDVGSWCRDVMHWPIRRGLAVWIAASSKRGKIVNNETRAYVLRVAPLAIRSAAARPPAYLSLTRPAMRSFLPLSLSLSAVVLTSSVSTSCAAVTPRLRRCAASQEWQLDDVMVVTRRRNLDQHGIIIELSMATHGGKFRGTGGRSDRCSADACLNQKDCNERQEMAA